MVELGYAKIQVMNWFGLFAPKGLPTVLAERIAAEAVKGLAEPSVAQSLRVQGLTPTPLRGAALADFLASEMARYRVIIAETGITAQ